MTIGAETSALTSVATFGEPPQKPAEQVEYLFAQQLLHALTESVNQGEGEEGAGYVNLLNDSLAREIARTGGLGIGQQLMPHGGDEVTP